MPNYLRKITSVSSKLGNLPDPSDHGDTLKVPRIERPSDEYFRLNFLVLQKPVVITGVVTQWRAYSAWDKDYLISRVGTTSIPVRISDHAWNPDPAVTTTDMTMEDYIETAHASRLPGDRHLYMGQLPLRKYLSCLIDDIEIPRFFGEPEPQPYFWLSAANGSKTNLHFDTAQNFLAQIRGRKRVMLYPPGKYNNFYPAFKRISQVDPYKSTVTEYPLFPFHSGIECVLNPGEMLYIPIHWWHHVESEESGVSVSFFQRPHWPLAFWWYEQRNSLRYRWLKIKQKALSGLW